MLNFDNFIPNILDITLFTFPSKTGKGLLKAIDNTADAVYSPTPGNAKNSFFIRNYAIIIINNDFRGFVEIYAPFIIPQPFQSLSKESIFDNETVLSVGNFLIHFL